MLHVAVADAMLRLDSLIYGMGWVIASSGATIHNHNQGGMLGVGWSYKRCGEENNHTNTLACMWPAGFFIFFNFVIFEVEPAIERALIGKHQQLQADSSRQLLTTNRHRQLTNNSTHIS